MALIQAKKAFIKNEVPVGAIVFNKDGIISKAYNMVITKNDPLAHAEVIALKKATKKLKTTNLMHLCQNDCKHNKFICKNTKFIFAESFR